MIISEEEYFALRSKWDSANQKEINAGRRPLKPIPPANRVRKEGWFGLYIGPWRYKINIEDYAGII